jgi:hypothetical protein
MGSNAFEDSADGITVYYFDGKPGFASPSWQGCPAANMEAWTPFNLWLIENEWAYETDPLQENNGGGVPLLIAYALKLDPQLNLPARMPGVVLEGSQLSLSFYAGKPDILYRLEASTNLTSWSPAGVTLSAPDAGGKRTATVNQDGPARYLRLVVSQCRTFSGLFFPCRA